MKRDTLVQLVNVYNKHGYNSNEFIKHITPYLKYLQHRLIGRTDNDFEQDCLIRLLDSFRYYDPICGVNLASWIFTVVRNRASSWRAKSKRLQRENGYLSDDLIEQVIAEPEQRDETEPMLFGEEDVCHWFFLSMKKVKIDIEPGMIHDDLMVLGKNNPLVRAVMWGNLCHGTSARTFISTFPL